MFADVESLLYFCKEFLTKFFGIDYPPPHLRVLHFYIACQAYVC